MKMAFDLLNAVFICIQECSLCHVDFFAQKKLQTSETLETVFAGLQPQDQAFIGVIRNQFSTEELVFGYCFLIVLVQCRWEEKCLL